MTLDQAMTDAEQSGFIRNAPSPEGYALGEHLARFCAAELAKLKERYPNHVEPCATCAFRKGTFANGCAATQMDALKCVMEKTEFHCHEKQNEGRVCAGWFILAGSGSGKPVKAPWALSDAEQQAERAVQPPRIRLCRCCGEWWIPLPDDTASICLRCDRGEILEGQGI